MKTGKCVKAGAEHTTANGNLLMNKMQVFEGLAAQK